MALISSKGMYGLAAMYELCMLKSSKPVQIKDISTNANIPQNYLEQLLSQLKKAGLVNSTRGAYGGYQLSKDANKISVKEIFEALEGELDIAQECTQNPALALFYKEKKIELEKIFNLSLEELIKYQQKVSRQICYNI